MKIERIEEYQITASTTSHIQKLLQQAFWQFPDQRIYYKQVPHFRYLVWDEDILAAQVGVEFRIIALNNQPVRIFGIMDLCVDSEYRSQNIGSNLLEKIEAEGLKHNIDFILLFAGDQRIYKNQGYQQVNNTCKWLLINNHQSLGVVHRNINLMVKQLGFKQWKEGVLADLLGFVF